MNAYVYFVCFIVFVFFDANAMNQKHDLEQPNNHFSEHFSFYKYIEPYGNKGMVNSFTWGDVLEIREHNTCYEILTHTTNFRPFIEKLQELSWLTDKEQEKGWLNGKPNAEVTIKNEFTRAHKVTEKAFLTRYRHLGKIFRHS